MTRIKHRPRSGTKPTIAIVLQGLQVGGMERCAIQLATCAIGAGHDARLILYDAPSTRSQAEYDPGDIPVTFVPRTHGIDCTLPVRLARVFRSWNVHIVHARNNVAGFYSAVALRLLHDPPPLVLTLDTFPGPGTAKARLASRWASRRAANVSSVSAELSNRLVQSGWLTQCDTVWNGVDTRSFSPQGPPYKLKERLGLPETTMVVGHLARLETNKRQCDLIEAFGRVTAAKNGMALAIAGDGPDREETETAARHAKNVFSLGIVHDAAGFLRSIDIFVLCSDDEGCPRALLEAMACEKPIVATAVGGIPEIVGDCGLLVPPRRPDLLAQAIRKLCYSNELRGQLGRAARRRVLESFTLEQEWSHYQRMYESAVLNPTERAIQ
jgi:glycosyltransferase involved in cell wall biosynthesis